MAGVKGKSGGPRPNSGGKRIGAGAKPKKAVVLTPAEPVKAMRKTPAVTMEQQPHGGALKRNRQPPADVLAGMGEEGFDPRPALEQVAQGLLDPSPAQMKALVALMPYVHTKRGEGGKKEQRQEKAEKVAGRFTPSAPPKLAAVGGRKV